MSPFTSDGAARTSAYTSPFTSAFSYPGSLQDAKKDAVGSHTAFRSSTPAALPDWNASTSGNISSSQSYSKLFDSIGSATEARDISTTNSTVVSYFDDSLASNKATADAGSSKILPSTPARSRTSTEGIPLASTPPNGADEVIQMLDKVRDVVHRCYAGCMLMKLSSCQQTQSTEYRELRKTNDELRATVDLLINKVEQMSEQLRAANEKASHFQHAATSTPAQGQTPGSQAGGAVNDISAARNSMWTPDAFSPFPRRQTPQQASGLVSAATPPELKGNGANPADRLDPKLHSFLMQSGRPFNTEGSQGAQSDGANSPANSSSRQVPALLFRPNLNRMPSGTLASPLNTNGSNVGSGDSSGEINRGADRWAALRDEARDAPSRRRTGPGATPSTPADTLVSQVLSTRFGQDASITLQQQLKSDSLERQQSIVEAMRPQLVELCQDKHGNFLVQRAIGVDPSLARDLRGKFVDLSLSQFGCHVVQRVLDEPEEIKMLVVQELLSDRIMETLGARSSVHIWQKALEIRWDHPTFRTTIFEVINNTLRGKWAETAMQETGSIICQNIFESADPSEKRECIEEILQRIPECASNQWGVWVVQHMIDNGEKEHREVVFARLLEQAVQLTLNNYGQKAIMTALKTNEPSFMVPFVDILCKKDESNQRSITSSRRSVLIDIACVPQGFNIVTQLLTNVDGEQRERIITTVRKNSVFLKGSKAGLRVHTLCGE